MKDKEKHIEEMAKATCTNVAKHCIDCKDCSEYSDCILVAHAINLYDDNYRKLPKDSVVLTKEKYQELFIKAQKSDRIVIDLSKPTEEEIRKIEREAVISELNVQMKQAVERTRKETAKKIYRMADEIITGSQNDGDKILAMIKEKFGVEIKE